MVDEHEVIEPAQLCYKHQHELVHRARYAESDPWQALMIAAQIVLFQAASCNDQFYKDIEGDITRIGELGCLACKQPKIFNEVIKAAKTKDIGKIKELGDKYIAEAKKSTTH